MLCWKGCFTTESNLNRLLRDFNDFCVCFGEVQKSGGLLLHGFNDFLFADMLVKPAVSQHTEQHGHGRCVRSGRRLCGALG